VDRERGLRTWITHLGIYAL